jgi:hypothetical protein
LNDLGNIFHDGLGGLLHPWIECSQTERESVNRSARSMRSNLEPFAQ